MSSFEEEIINNGRVSGAIEFIKSKMANYELKKETGENWVRAMTPLAEMRTENEGDDVDTALSKLEEWATRWSRKNPSAKGDTAKTYVGRARHLLTNYKAWQANPKDFSFDLAERKPRTPKPPAVATKTAPEAVEAAPTNGARTYSYPTLNGGEIKVTIPKGTVLADINRLTYFLVPLAEDFNPPGAAPVTPPPPPATLSS